MIFVRGSWGSQGGLDGLGCQGGRDCQGGQVVGWSSCGGGWIVVVFRLLEWSGGRSGRVVGVVGVIRLVGLFGGQGCRGFD